MKLAEYIERFTSIKEVIAKMGGEYSASGLRNACKDKKPAMPGVSKRRLIAEALTGLTPHEHTSSTVYDLVNGDYKI